MHDYYAVKALLERLTSEIGDLDLDRITEVRVRASSTLSPEALEQAYEMLTQDTPLEGSRLMVEELPDERECPACGGSWAVAHGDLVGHVLVCPSCGALSPIEGGTGLEVLGITR